MSSESDANTEAASSADARLPEQGLGGGLKAFLTERSVSSGSPVLAVGVLASSTPACTSLAWGSAVESEKSGLGRLGRGGDEASFSWVAFALMIRLMSLLAFHSGPVATRLQVLHSPRFGVPGGGTPGIRSPFCWRLQMVFRL